MSAPPSDRHLLALRIYERAQLTGSFVLRSGEDYPAGDDPDLEKRVLEEENCDPTVREPFIATLTRDDFSTDQSG